jgi:hypothetical protein
MSELLLYLEENIYWLISLGAFSIVALIRLHRPKRIKFKEYPRVYGHKLYCRVPFGAKQKLSVVANRDNSREVKLLHPNGKQKIHNPEKKAIISFILDFVPEHN